jgi:hypothetical protein
MAQQPGIETQARIGDGGTAGARPGVPEGELRRTLTVWHADDVSASSGGMEGGTLKL